MTCAIPLFGRMLFGCLFLLIGPPLFAEGTGIIVIYKETPTPTTSTAIQGNMVQHVATDGTKSVPGVVSTTAKTIFSQRYWLFDIQKPNTTTNVTQRFTSVSYFKDSSGNGRAVYSSISTGFPFVLTPVKTLIGSAYTSGFSARWTWQTGGVGVLERQTAGQETSTTSDDVYAPGLDLSASNVHNTGVIDTWGVDGETAFTAGTAVPRFLNSSGTLLAYVPSTLTTSYTELEELMVKNFDKVSAADPGNALRRSRVNNAASVWTLDDKLTKDANSVDVLGPLLGDVRTLENGIEAVRMKLLLEGFREKKSVQ